MSVFFCFDWCCFYYFGTNSLVASLKALFGINIHYKQGKCARNVTEAITALNLATFFVWLCAQLWLSSKCSQTEHWPMTIRPMYLSISIFISWQDMYGPVTLSLHEQKVKGVLKRTRHIQICPPSRDHADWCCFYYFVRNSLVALLKALCARIFFFRFVDRGMNTVGSTLLSSKTPRNFQTSRDFSGALS